MDNSKETFDIIINKLNKKEIPTDKEVDNFLFSKKGRQIREHSFYFSDIGRKYWDKQIQELTKRVKEEKEEVEKEERQGEYKKSGSI